eukprot:CAMPEP_0171355902 /NCGR_PEP_ID=MMETSP0878-20121228/45456_1 /TAXON_ID=67004 /ORGANISM="Thalassiosira weissflogii, Strain CCMP1336" /LENGTH=1026 /DNA_ID=CAMNT_0011861909 /DNA_START=34 /DNA_END=3114 /DNA_ORIENTATION=+
MIMKPKFPLLSRKSNGNKSHHATSPGSAALTNDNSSGDNSVSTWASASSPSSASSTSSLFLPSKKKSSFRFLKRRSKRLDATTSATAAVAAADVRPSSSSTHATTSSTTTTTPSQSPSPSPSPSSPILPPPPPPPTKALLTPSERHHLLRGTSCNAPFVPLSRHFDTQSHLLSLFDALYFHSGTDGDDDDDDDDDGTATSRNERPSNGYSIAYAVGLRYVEMALFRLPCHGYYRSDGVREERRESLGQAARVARLLRDGMEGDSGAAAAATTATNALTTTTTTKKKKETLRQLENLARRSLERETKEERPRIFCGGGPRWKSNGGETKHESASKLWREYIVDGSENICNLLALGCAGGVECVQDVCGGGKDSTGDPYEIYQEEKKLEMEDVHDDEMSSQLHGDLNKDEETLVTPEPLVVSSFASDTAVAEENASQETKAENKSIHKQISLQGDSTQSSEDVADRYASISSSRVAENHHQPHHQHPQQQQLLGADPTASDEPPSINTESLVTAMEDEAEEAELLISHHSAENYDDTTGFNDDDLNLAIGLSMSMSMSMSMNVSVSGNSVADTPPSPSNDPSNDDSDNAVMASRSFQSSSHPREQNDCASMTLSGSASSGSAFASLARSSTPVAVTTPSPTPSTEPIPTPIPITTTTPNVDLRSMTQRYRQRYQTLLAKRKFHYRFLQTYQGRNPESTNGCTVIAPLTCIHYFIHSEDDDRDTTAMYLSSSSSHTRNHRHGNTNDHIRNDGNELCYNPAWEHGLHDEMIHHVIDEHAPAVLPIVRGKLGLAKDSFIIPSDVHEHLMEEGLLTTSQFVGVCGGNILDDDHIAQFKSTLLIEDPHERKRLQGKKIAAAFFFHGHVIALHVIRKSGNGRPLHRHHHHNNKSKTGEFDPADVTVELIDSLPHPSTWAAPDSGAASDCEEREPVQERVSRGGTTIDCYDNYNDDDDGDEEWERPEQFDDDADLNQNAIRVRCTDIEHLDTLLRHYACSKFSGEEWKFIRENEWEENNSYFDPRVFQAFVWAEA